MSKITAVDNETQENLELIYIYDATNLLGVSKQRINQIAKENKIKVYNVFGWPFFKKSDVLQYAKTRKVGRPAKKD